MRYEWNEMFGLLPMGYFAMISGLGIMMGDFSDCCHKGC